MKKFLLLCTALLITILLAQNLLAVSVNPGSNNFGDVSAGDVINGKLTIENTENIPNILNIEVADYVVEPINQTKQFVDYDTPRGLKKYIKLNIDTTKSLDPNTTADITYTITLPKDIAPGSYTTGLLVSGQAPGTEGTSVGIAARAASIIYLNIKGDAKEELSLTSFNVNPVEQLKGLIEFDVKIKNSGDVRSYPTGGITIYDKDGKQVEGIYAVTKTFVEGEEPAVISRANSIPVGEGKENVFPDSENTIRIPWLNRNVESGKYTAKLELFYGADSKKLTSETTFDIKENFYINNFEPEATFKSSLPISFKATIVNAGNTPLDPKGYFEIKNIFGSQKKRMDFVPEELKLDGGAEKTLANISWDNGFALGLYTANLSLDVGGKTFTKSVSFWILNWWQIATGIVVIIALIYLLYMGIRGYRKMKKRLKDLEKNKK